MSLIHLWHPPAVNPENARQVVQIDIDAPVEHDRPERSGKRSMATRERRHRLAMINRLPKIKAKLLEYEQRLPTVSRKAATRRMIERARAEIAKIEQEMREWTS